MKTFVLGNTAFAWILAALQVVLLPFLALAMVIGSPATFWALLKAWLVQFGALTAPLVVPFIMARAPRGIGGASVWWRIYNTLDDPSNEQGMYEPQVRAVFDALGWRWKTFYWLAARNVCYGLANRMRPAYDFATAKFAVDSSKVTMTWNGGEAVEYRIFFGKPHIAFGYKIAEAYLDSLDPIKINQNIDKNPDTDVGGVPFFTVRMK
jgi:hypothetical protein